MACPTLTECMRCGEPMSLTTIGNPSSPYATIWHCRCGAALIQTTHQINKVWLQGVSKYEDDEG